MSEVLRRIGEITLSFEVEGCATREEAATKALNMISRHQEVLLFFGFESMVVDGMDYGACPSCGGSGCIESSGVCEECESIDSM